MVSVWPKTTKRADLRLSSSAETGLLVQHRAALIAVRAVVVARQDVRVHIAQTDPVVSLLLAGIDAALVAVDTGVDNVLSSAVGCEGGGCQSGERDEEGCGAHVEELTGGLRGIVCIKEVQMYKCCAEQDPERVMGSTVSIEGREKAVERAPVVEKQRSRMIGMQKVRRPLLGQGHRTRVIYASPCQHNLAPPSNHPPRPWLARAQPPSKPRNLAGKNPARHQRQSHRVPPRKPK